MDIQDLTGWLEKLDDKMDAQSKKLNSIEIQTTKTNGRVNALEDIITHRRLGIGKVLTYTIAIGAILVSYIK